MKKKQKPLQMDELIDRFVETINRLPREPGFEEDVPPSVRGEPDDPEAWHVCYDWRITPWPIIDWIEPMEHPLGLMLPSSFRSLVTRYVFPRFEAGPFWFFANTPEGNLTELRNMALWEGLYRHGYIPFANPSDNSFDPICFDTRKPRAGGEWGVVRIDHESVLCDGVVGNTRDVAFSFASFVADFIQPHSS